MVRFGIVFRVMVWFCLSIQWRVMGGHFFPVICWVIWFKRNLFLACFNVIFFPYWWLKRISNLLVAVGFSL